MALADPFHHHRSITRVQQYNTDRVVLQHEVITIGAVNPSAVLYLFRLLSIALQSMANTLARSRKTAKDTGDQWGVSEPSKHIVSGWELSRPTHYMRMAVATETPSCSNFVGAYVSLLLAVTSPLL